MTSTPAARTLQRRLRAKQLYRIRRDRKLREEWLGKRFILTIQDELTGLPQEVQVEVAAYWPETATVSMGVYTQDQNRFLGYTAWDTDKFWSLLRTGTLRFAP